MKVAIIFLLLTTTTVKEKDACRDSRRHSRRNPYTPVADESDELYLEIIDPENDPYMQERAKLFVIPEEERQWRKDHQKVLPAITEALSPGWTELDPDADGLKKTFEQIEKNKNQLASKWECVEVATFKDHYKTIMKEEELPTNNNWDLFFAGISNCHMYPGGSDKIIDDLLRDMLKLKVTKVENFGAHQGEGSQMKLKLTFENGKQAIFKPMRFGIDYEKDPNEFYFGEIEKANAEVAAFYLDKLLDFRRAVPTVYRKFTVSTELKDKTPENSNITYFLSPEGNLCFIGTCKLYCDSAHAICAVDDVIFGSVQAWLPAAEMFDDSNTIPELYIGAEDNPYARTYTTKDAEWQKNQRYCYTNVTLRPAFKNGRRLLDMVDLSIFDFLIGNQDRHSFDSFVDFYYKTISLYRDATDKSFIITMDNGRGFGNPHPPDDLDILAALIQCCRVRPSTVKRLLEFYKEGTSLATELEESMRKLHPRDPILADKYLNAINRRHEIVLKKIAKCIKDADFDRDKVFTNYYGQPFAIVKQRKQSKNLVEPMNRGGQTSIITPMADHMHSIDLEITAEETHSVEHTRQISNNNVETKQQGDQFNQGKAIPGMVGHLRKVDRIMKRQEPDELLRPTPDDSLSNFLIDILAQHPPDSPCPNEKWMKIKTNSPWGQFYGEISNCHLYRKDSQVVKDVVGFMRTADIEHAIQEYTPQFSIKVTFAKSEKARAICKPMKFDRNYETNPNHFYFDDFERPNAEIAAFHLDRLLGFRRVAPTAGRAFNIQTLVRGQEYPNFKFMHFRSPAKKYCLYSFSTSCAQYCSIEHGYCGELRGKIWEIDGSVQLWLNEFDGTPTDSPYMKIRDGYTIKSKRNDTDYCNRELKAMKPYNKGRLLLDLVDLHIFDFLTGNQERDQFNFFKFDGKNPAFIFVTENGKAFGNPRVDDTTILAPLTQCCVVRPSTVLKLLEFYRADASLGQQLDESLKEEGHLHPVLAKKYLIAINRRVEIVLQKVQECLKKAKKGGEKTVLMNSLSRPWLPWFRGARDLTANDDI